MPRTKRSKHQGALDGLCGAYAIVNAAQFCGVDEPEAVFEAACRALPQERWPDVLFNGTTFDELKLMARAATRRRRIRVTAPFHAKPPKNEAAFWEGFDEFFDYRDATCAIIGLEHPWNHWTVVRKDGSRVLFADSDASNLVYRKNRASLWPGKWLEKRGQWRLNPRELLIFGPRRLL